MQSLLWEKLELFSLFIAIEHEKTSLRSTEIRAKQKKKMIKMCEFNSQACDREAADGFLNGSFNSKEKKLNRRLG